ncbi:hypothetical protein Q5M85_02355 [Paraclostridium bifermentans]|nr:hypothetical protein [Paraclostridium bifermentans]
MCLEQSLLVHNNNCAAPHGKDNVVKGVTGASFFKTLPITKSSMESVKRKVLES